MLDDNIKKQQITLDGQYDFAQNEVNIRNFWDQTGLYKTPELPSDRSKIWTLVCPPPNAYDRPHMGNLSGYVYMDMMARYQRLRGKTVVMLPGKDHAGLEGEAVFVRDQLTPQGKKKSDFTREEFYDMLYRQQQEFITMIQQDEQLVGLSADFEKDLYTLDPKVVGKVLQTFIDLYQRGLVYKGTRIVNWDPGAQSAISDSQCEREERDGKLYYLKYELVDSIVTGENKYLTIATSRPETIFADTAVAVNPEDPRYAHLIGSKVRIPLTDRWIPIIASKRVEKDFGTGVLKITPAHATDDYTIMQEWNSSVTPDLQISYVNCIGKVAELVGPVPSKYLGKKAKAVRDEIETDLQNEGILEKTENIKQNVLVSERTKAVVEPMMASQWFLKVDHLKEELKKLVTSGDLTLHPKDAENKLFAWIDNLRDWSISRTLWWGYRLPVWYHGEKVETNDENGQVQLKLRIESQDYNEWPINFYNSGIINQIIEGSKTIETRVLNPEESDRYFGNIKVGDKIIGIRKQENNAIAFEKKVKEIRRYKDIESEWQSVEWNKVFTDKSIDSLDNVISEYNSLSEGYGNKLKMNGLVAIYFEDWSDSNDNSLVDLDFANPDLVRIQIDSPGDGWVQDEEVLDTWFSSGQWPYLQLSTWEMMDMYPIDCLMSAGDLLIKWDLIMMIMSVLKGLGTPFKNLYLTGLVLGTDGQKMSKSKKNFIRIDEVVEKYGIDSFRMNCLFKVAPFSNYIIKDDTLKGFRNFNNKIWNASKFVLQTIEPDIQRIRSEFNTSNISGLAKTTLLPEIDINIDNIILESNKNMLLHLQEMKGKYIQMMDSYKFWIITEDVYLSFWNIFCDKYIEETKSVTGSFNKETRTLEHFDTAEAFETRKVLYYTLAEYLKMLHPYVPYVTERIFMEL